MVKDLQNDSQGHGCFRSGQDNDKYGKYMTIDAQSAIAGEGHKVKAGGIEDQLHAHEDIDRVTARQQRQYAAEKKYGIPGIIIDADQVDLQFYSDAQLDTRIQALLEMIDARR